MAIRYKDLKEPEVNNPLSLDELKAIDAVEKYIDEKIKEQWTNTYGVSVDLGIALFEYDPVLHKPTDLNVFRREKMQRELGRRYKEAGWNIKVHIDDGLDGPNVSGSDYWILTPNEK